MEPITSAHELFLLDLRHVRDAEERFLGALQFFHDSASNQLLKEGFMQHLEQTREHVARLDEVAESLDEEIEAKENKVVKTMVEEATMLIQSIQDPAVKDVALIKAARASEHYEIAAYSFAVAHAKEMGHDEALALLEKTLKEEQDTDMELGKLAEKEVNPAASESEEK